MSLKIITIPLLSDNYAYLLHCTDSAKTALIDAPDATPILTELHRHKWQLDMILITHHHSDHIDGIKEIKAQTKAKVIGAKADAHRLPKLDKMVSDGDKIAVGKYIFNVIDVPGHTLGHIAFISKKDQIAFSGDSLMALGCGRIFEGSPSDMWESINKFKQLPADTLLYSGHEYSNSNAQFALTIEPDNPKLLRRAQYIKATRANNDMCMPTTLKLEMQTNPFLRAHLPAIKANIGMPDVNDLESFREIRRRKDNF